jgi:hypothetical protein
MVRSLLGHPQGRALSSHHRLATETVRDEKISSAILGQQRGGQRIGRRLADSLARMCMYAARARRHPQLVSDLPSTSAAATS